MDYVIQLKEYQNLIEKKTASGRLSNYWQDILKQLPAKFSKELENQDFSLRPHPQLKNTSYAQNLCFFAENASDELNEYLTEVDKAVICMLDPV